MTGSGEVSPLSRALGQVRAEAARAGVDEMPWPSNESAFPRHYLRRRADELGVNLTQIRAALDAIGEKGGIRREHVEEAAIVARGLRETTEPVAASAASEVSTRIAAAKASNERTYPKHYLRGYADELGVDLASVHGTGVGGVVRERDIAAAAAAVSAAEQPPFDLEALREDVRIAARASYDVLASSHAETSPMGLNPLVARAEASRAGAIRAAGAPSAPTLFTGGDLPAFTASGIPPAALTRVPWNARHAMAAAPTSAAAYDIADAFEGLSPADTEELAGALGYAAHPGALRYGASVQSWVNATSSDMELEGQLHRPPAADV